MRTAAVMFAALAATATAASAQNMVNYSWTVSDTGNANGIIEPGERGVFTLSATLTGPTAPYFAGSVFNVMNSGGLETGTFTSLVRNSALNMNPVGGGTADPMGNISAIDVFQLPFALGAAADLSNPITLYTIQWQPNDYTPRAVSGMDMHITTQVYADPTSFAAVDAPGIGGSFVAQVVPAPGAAALLAAAGLTAIRRGRRS